MQIGQPAACRRVRERVMDRVLHAVEPFAVRLTVAGQF